MRILLDTNIVIHRENKRVSNYSINASKLRNLTK